MTPQPKIYIAGHRGMVGSARRNEPVTSCHGLALQDGLAKAYSDFFQGNAHA